jgi:hypothetical protein
MIVRNESSHIDACLRSASDLADEVVIVDTGSTDDTKEIALRHGARVFDYPWVDDFAAARNEALRHCRGEWVFTLDADDRVVPTSRTRIAKLFSQLDDRNAAYLMRVVSPAPDGGPMFEVLHPRVFRNDPRIRWEYRVHEQIAPAVRRAGGRLVLTDIGIVHVGYKHPADVQAKLERNLRLIDLNLEQAPVDGFLLACRAGTLLDMRRGTEALVSLSLCEAAYAGFEVPPDVHLSRSRAHAMDGVLHEALGSVRQGLATHPRDTKLQYAEAGVCAAMGDLDEAERVLRGLLLVGGEHAAYGCADWTIDGFRARHLLSAVLLQKGSYAEAESEARAVTIERPGYGPAWLTLAEAALGQGKEDAFGAVRDRCYPSAQSLVVRSLLDSIQHRVRGDPAEALSILEALDDNAAAPGVMQERVMAMFQGGARGERLVEAVRALLELEPLNLRAWAVRRSVAGPRALREERMTWTERAARAVGPLIDL